ncbi:collectin-10 isoform 2-T2 [Macrochelys suwanniensis]
MSSMKGQQWRTCGTLVVLFIFQVQILGFNVDSQPATDVCSTHTILPGPKGDDGEKGDQGEVGKHGKVGPKGPKGNKGAVGDSGDQGMIGKIGPIGGKGDKGVKGLSGVSGGKGKAGTVCDCGRYRKVVGQLDINVARLKTSMKFVKNGHDLRTTAAERPRAEMPREMLGSHHLYKKHATLINIIPCSSLHHHHQKLSCGKPISPLYGLFPLLFSLRKDSCTF